MDDLEGLSTPISRRADQATDHYWASLRSLDGREVLRCVPDDVAEGSLRVTAPVGYGFAVGQRYELLLGVAYEEQADQNLISEGNYATVTRTEFHLEQGGDRVEVGLRFDQPIVI